MSPPEAVPWHPERFCFIAAAPSASTGVTARDKADRLEARTVFREPEPDERPEAVAEPGAPQAGVAAAEPDAAAGAGPDAQLEAAAELDARREAVAPDAAVVAEPDAQQEVAEASGARLVAAAVSDAQQAGPVAVASDAQRAAGPAVARLLVASVELAETAAVRFWIPAMLVWAAALRPALVSAAKVQAAADR
jgi:hypothetical protein